jgi:hypothetical protein
LTVDHFTWLNVLLISGFVSFVSGISSHVITKWRLVGSYITREQQAQILESMHSVHLAAIEKLTAQCQFNQQKCPIWAVQRDIDEIKKVQIKRTADLERFFRGLSRRQQAEILVWRAILEALHKNLHEQNEILGELLIA